MTTIPVVGWSHSSIQPPTTYDAQSNMNVPTHGEAVTRMYHNNREFASKVKVVPFLSSIMELPTIGGSPAPLYHVPGTRLVPQISPPKAKRLLRVDDVLVSAHFLDALDKAKDNQLNLHQYTSSEQGAAIAEANDRNIAISIAIAARTASNVAGIAGGTTISNPLMLTNMDVLYAAIVRAGITLDTNKVGRRGGVTANRYLALKNALVQNLNYVKSGFFYNRELGGTQGSIHEASVLTLAGFQILTTEHLPSTDITTVTGKNNPHTGNFTNLAGLFWVNEPGISPVVSTYLNIGTVNSGMPSQSPAADNNLPALMAPLGVSPVSTLQIELPEYNGTLSAAMLVMGSNTWRPDAAGELTTS